MCQAFIATVLDIVEHDEATVDSGCEILTDALAPAIEIGAPPGLLQHVGGHFREVLKAHGAKLTDRDDAETLLNQVFSMAAARDYDGLNRLIST